MLQWIFKGTEVLHTNSNFLFPKSLQLSNLKYDTSMTSGCKFISKRKSKIVAKPCFHDNCIFLSVTAAHFEQILVTSKMDKYVVFTNMLQKVYISLKSKKKISLIKCEGT